MQPFQLTVNSQLAQLADSPQEGLLSSKAGWRPMLLLNLSQRMRVLTSIWMCTVIRVSPLSLLPPSYVILTCLGSMSNKHILKHSEPERPAKVQKRMKSQLAATQDNGEERVRSDPLAELEVSRQSLEFMDARFDIDGSCQDAFTKQLTSVMYMPDLSLFPLVYEHDSASTHTAADARTSIGPGGLHTQPPTNDQLAADQLDEKFLKLLDPEMLNQHPSGRCPQDSAPSQAFSTEADVSFSSTSPLPVPQLLPDEMQALPTQFSRHPPPEYKVVKDYWNGKMFSNSYLDEIRGTVDPAFSNDNWGDKYYFSDVIGFKHLEDFKPDTGQRVNDIATLEGLQLRAKAIPHRTAKESWNSYYAIMNRVAGGDGKGKAPLMSFEGTGQHIRRAPMLTDSPSSPHGLQHGVQAQKGIDCRNMMQGIPPVMPVAPGTHPVQFGATRLTSRNIDSSGDSGLVGDGNSDHSPQMQQLSW